MTAAEKFIAEVKGLETDTSKFAALCRLEPEWAASRLSHERKQANRLVAMVEAARTALAYYASPGANDNHLNRPDHVIWEGGETAKAALAELDRIAADGAK